jgi:SpoVK/Ycf46/Vps4 family AAA+-type ATPase
VKAKLRTALIWVALFIVFCSAILAVGIDEGEGFGLRPVLYGVLLLTGIVLALVWFGRRAQAQQAQGMQNFNAFRQNKARLVQPGAEATRFTDVGGLADVKESLADVVDWLKAPDRWKTAGVRPPRGVLLEGPPGTGKTLLARAIAGEAGVKFYVANATEFVEMFVGVGPARMRDLFEAAAKTSPCVIFIDELDAIGRRRGSGVGFANEEREHALNELLVQMDGFERQGRFVVVGASNRADVLDAALLRPGRFDLRLRVSDLGEADRLEVLRVHARGRNLAPDSDLAVVAARTQGSTGAILEAIVNEAALQAMRRGRGGGSPAVTQADLLGVLARAASIERPFTVLDQLLVESAGQLAEPATACWVELELTGGVSMAGRVVWANPELLKISTDTGARLVSRRELRELRAVEAPTLSPPPASPPPVSPE